MAEQACESCGREFACGADTGDCWCNGVELGPERLAILREHFERCLCPDCLALAAAPAAHERAPRGRGGSPPRDASGIS